MVVNGDPNAGNWRNYEVTANVSRIALGRARARRIFLAHLSRAQFRLNRINDADFDKFIAEPNQMVGVIVRTWTGPSAPLCAALRCAQRARAGQSGNAGYGTHYLAAWSVSRRARRPLPSSLIARPTGARPPTD